MNTIKAIETNYNGYRFRSRIEARWAVFFDELGIVYDYEPEGFALDSGYYLPDFWLPDIGRGTWFEGKGTRPHEIGFRMLRELAEPQGHDWAMAVGSIEPFHGRGPWAIESNDDGPYSFCSCPWCGKIGIEYEGRGARVCGWDAHFLEYQDALAAVIPLGHWRADDKCYTYDDPRIVSAIKAARSARFEYGSDGRCRDAS